MFERRLKVFLAVLLVFTVALVLRAGYVQVVQHAAWEERAVNARTRSDRSETSRGEIRDRNGRRVAIEEPCVDATVDYRALTPEPDAKWVEALSWNRVRDLLRDDYARTPRDRRKAMFEKECVKVRDQISQMWPRLARIAERPPEELDDVRRSIVEKVRMRRRHVWYYGYLQAMKEYEKGAKAAAATQPASVWKHWLLDEGGDPPEVDTYQLNVTEQSAQHVVVHGLSREAQVELTTYLDQFPGLELSHGTRRVYPFEDVGAHVLGRLSKVDQEDMRRDPASGNELRQYELNDLIGRGGVEGMCEQVLRGVRGRERKLDGQSVAVQEAVPGKDVQITIDFELQQEVQTLFNSVPVKYSTADAKDPPPDRLAMHGAAVVIDVASGEVLTLASAPSFNLNKYDEQYAALTSPDNLDQPALNRATQATREPGSTVKPIVGLAGVASGVRRVDEGYECTGYMVVNGRYARQGRCWVNSMFHNVLCPQGAACTRFPCPAVAHHVVPSDPAHPGGIPLLMLPDALERSCNPYFESIAGVLGPEALTNWFIKFGLGRPTYIGIAERAGVVPYLDSAGKRRPNTQVSTWTAGIGQGPVQATPLQMANVAATLARGGVWVRPRLLRPQSMQDLGPLTSEPDRVDLGLSPDSLRAVREGMIRVVNSRAGSGGAAARTDMVVAGKTGSAQAATVRPYVYDPVTRRKVRDANGKPLREDLRPSSHSEPNPRAPWYRDTGKEGNERPTLTHSWFIGYAPADNPQVAFAVLVEYGGGGGAAAGSVAKQVIQLCMDHGYLKLTGKAPAGVAVAVPAAAGELLHDAAR